MKRKSIFSVALLCLAFFLSIPFFAFSQKSKEPIVEDGIYMGRFGQTPMFYEVKNHDIKKFGLSFPFYGIQIEDETAFYLLINKNYFQSFIYCEKLAIGKSDYSKAEINTDKEFIGFTCGPLLGDPQYRDGIIIAIKDTLNGKMLITILDLKEYNFYQAIGTVTQEQGSKPHRKLSFTVNGEINKWKKEKWDITLNPITNYVWGGIFNVYINGKWRFEVEVIDNGNKPY